MSINSVPPNELADHRKAVSDKRDSNPELSIADSSSNNPRSRAYMKIRDIKSRKELTNIIMGADNTHYFEELMNDG